ASTAGTADGARTPAGTPRGRPVGPGLPAEDRGRGELLVGALRQSPVRAVSRGCGFRQPMADGRPRTLVARGPGWPRAVSRCGRARLRRGRLRGGLASRRRERAARRLRAEPGCDPPGARECRRRPPRLLHPGGPELRPPALVRLRRDLV